MTRTPTKPKLTAIFEFTETGLLKAILLNAPNEEGEKILQRALDRLLNPTHWGWIRKLFKRFR
jgi:hypothetical protein